MHHSGGLQINFYNLGIFFSLSSVPFIHVVLFRKFSSSAWTNSRRASGGSSTKYAIFAATETNTLVRKVVLASTMTAVLLAVCPSRHRAMYVRKAFEIM